jgi:hypothetical protein
LFYLSLSLTKKEENDELIEIYNEAENKMTLKYKKMIVKKRRRNEILEALLLICGN